MRIIYHPAATDELVEAANYYESRRIGLGGEFLAEFERAVSGIAQSPQMYARVRGETRRCTLQRFPYGVYYRDDGDDLRILVIKHHSRHPDHGLDRT
jgi:plasmid stabilization system protein ParE